VNSVPHPELTEIQRVALYCRVSTEEQADRKTVDAQLDFLRRWCDLHEIPVAGEYVDEDWSGTIPLGDRPAGQRLLQDAEARGFGSVLTYRLDRLGRSLAVLLEAHTTLDRHGITIRSATEPFDTASPIGRFMFQLLSSMAELEKSTIMERMTLGRDRVAREGKWTGGPVPFGYDIDAEGCLTPSARLVDGLQETEAEIARSVFERIARGSTTVAECRRLNALAVPTRRRYASGTTVTVGENWLPSRINAMVRNPVYAGRHVLKSRAGPIERAVPPLVSQGLWDQAQAQLRQNRTLATRNAQHRYLLRGLIRCAACGANFAGTPSYSPKAPQWVGHYYRCNSQLGAVRPEVGGRCRAKRLPTAWLDDEVWQDCRAFIQNPGEPLAEAQRQLRARMAETVGVERQRRGLQKQLAEKDAERERVLTLYRRNRITLDQAEQQLDDVGREAAELRQLMDSLASQEALAAAFETHLTEASAMLLRLQDQLAEIERTDDWARKREIVQLLVHEIRVTTEGEGAHKQARVLLRYAFGEPRAVDTTTGTRARIRDTGSETT
jgi:site-specific DNA recombinase